MGSKSISASDIRDALTQHIAGRSGQAVTDKDIIAHLKTHSTPVFSKGARFFIPVSAKFGDAATGDALVYSDGERAGQPIDNYAGQYGIKFRNAVDGIEQAVPGNGEGVIIIGGAVSPEKALLLQNKLDALTGGSGDPERLTKDGIQALLKYAQQQLKLDDIWEGDRKDLMRATPIDGHAIDAGSPTKHYAGYFYHQPKEGRDVAALYVKGGAKFKGDVAGGLQDYSAADGFYVTVGIGDDGRSQYRGIASDAFTRDYITAGLTPCDSKKLFTVDAETKEVTPPQQESLLAKYSSGRNTSGKTGQGR